MKAAIGAAIAVGAYRMLHDHNGVRYTNKSDCPAHHKILGVCNTQAHSGSDPPHYMRHLLEEVAGAYALGNELLGTDDIMLRTLWLKLLVLSVLSRID